MLFTTALALAALASSPVSALWPAPMQMTSGNTTLFMERNVTILYNGDRLNTSLLDPSQGINASAKDIVRLGVGRTLDAIFRDNFTPWKLRARHSKFEPDATAGRKWIQSINITQVEVDAPRRGYVDESYTMDVDQEGHVKIDCKSSFGCLYGLESFSQLFFRLGNESAWYTPHAPVSITDAPKFVYRGLLMDVARAWFSVEDIMRMIDAMAWNKMNRLHLHATDSQSWPLEVPALPRLAEVGAYSKGLSYSPKDLTRLFVYGMQRGVEVVLEIDMPGHTGVVELAYPNLTVAYDKRPYHLYCAEPPCGTLKINSSDTLAFVDKLLDDVLPRVSPYSSYSHTGGDELNVASYALEAGIDSNQTSVIAPHVQRFLNHVHDRVRHAGLVPLVWEEMVLKWELTTGSDVVVQSWLGNGAVQKLASAGKKVIDSDYNFWYLDCGRGAWVNYDNGPAFQAGYPFNDWCGPTKSWRLMYTHDPVAGLSSEEAKLVLGGEVAVWSELADSSNLDSLMWPRASAAGEVLWSGRQDASGQNRSQYDAAPRLAEFRERMVARGVRAMPVQMVYCTQGDASTCAQVVA